MTDYEIQRFTRQCSATGRDLQPGEMFYSVLIAHGDELTREDYAPEAWKGPPEEAVGWWKSEVPDAKAKKRNWAPNDVMLQFFDELDEQPERADMRFVLTLLLVRRRVMRLEESETDEEGREVLVLFCPRRDATYQVPAIAPDDSRIEAIQEELARLLE